MGYSPGICKESDMTEQLSTHTQFSSFQLLSHVRLFANAWTVAHQAALSVGFYRQEYWSGMAFSPPGDLPHPWIETVVYCVSCIAGGFFTAEPSGKPAIVTVIWH